MNSSSTFVEHCRELSRRKPTETAYVWLASGEEAESSWSFLELDRQARRVAAHLDERGLSGTRALLCFTPGLEFLAAFLGCMYAGVTAVPLNAPRNERAARASLGIAKHAGASSLLTDRQLSSTCESLCANLPSVQLIISEELSDDQAENWRPGTIDPRELAFIQYTSGSTGSPKGVEVTHANLIRNEEMIQAGFGHDEDTVFVSWLPMFHDMGLVGNVLQPLFLGVKSVLMSPATFVQKPVRWLRAMTEYGGTTTGGPNFGYELCVQRVREEHMEGLDLSSWKVAYSGSEPVRAPTLAAFEEKFARVGFRREMFYPCYGMAEASLFVTGGVSDAPYVTVDVDAGELEKDRVSLVEADSSARRLVGCGRPWLDQRVLIVDRESKTELPADRIGEIWIQGGNVARGYRGLEPGSEDPFRSFLANGDGPYFATGDLGFFQEGELFITGRCKDVLIQNGRNYYPQDIELAAAANHEFLRIDYTAAFTVEHEDAERLVIVQEVHRRHGRILEKDSPEGDALRSELIGSVRQAVSKEFGLTAWKVVLVKHASVPKTSSGKIQRRKCRELFQRGDLLELVPTTREAAQP